MRRVGDLLPEARPLRTIDPDRGGVMTRQGWFSEEDLKAAQAIKRADGTVIFPIGYRNIGFDEQTGKVIQEAIYPPLGREKAAERREIAEHDGHTFESRQEQYKQARKAFEKRKAERYGPRRGE